MEAKEQEKVKLCNECTVSTKNADSCIYNCWVKQLNSK